jgi:hypothetical protein
MSWGEFRRLCRFLVGRAFCSRRFRQVVDVDLKEWYKQGMHTDTIICPNCKAEVEVTEVLAAQLRADIQRQFDAEKLKQNELVAKQEADLRKREVALTAAQQAVDAEVQQRLIAERGKLSEEATKKARASLSLEFQDMQAQLTETKDKLTQAQQSELELRKKQRELEEQKRELEVTVQRRMDEEREKIRETAKRETIQERDLKDAEKDKVIGDLNKQIEELRRKSEQASQQLQGEVLELELEGLLRQQFPFDEITPVPKGIHGGDVLQTVRDNAGTACGTILWESKRTKSWSDSWLPKLRDDQRAAKAQIAIVISIELPKDVTTFRFVDGVWVSSRACSLSLASALRAGLLEVAAAKRAAEGRHDKMEFLYGYLSGQEFRHRVEGIVEAFTTLREDLETEKRAIQKSWAKREKQLERAVVCTSGMYGDLHGIIGKSLPQIELLEMPLAKGLQGPAEPEPS